MVREISINIGWAVVFATVGGAVGILLVLIGSMFLPRLIERMTPDLDEAKELARGTPRWASTLAVS